MILWPEQCSAAVTLRSNLGARAALEYLVGEKFLTCVRESFRHAEFEAALPDFAAEVRSIFTASELADYLGDLRARPHRRADGDPTWAAEEARAQEKAARLLLTV